MIKTDIFVSIDNSNFTKLDLEKSESIPMKYVQKDTQDLSKIFSPYSQSFNFKATPNNQKALEFWGKTEVLKLADSKLFYCKVYSNGLLSFTGFLKISSLSYKNGKADTYTGNFTTIMQSLKDRMGDDTLNDISDIAHEIDWSANNIYNKLQGTGTINNLKWFVPLISNSRVWGFDQADDSVLLDNIAYDAANAPLSNRTIKPTELRPVVDFKGVFDLIKNKYSLNVIEPFTDTNEYKNLYILCNGENMKRDGYKALNLYDTVSVLKTKDSANTALISDPKKYAITKNGNNVKVTRQATFDEYYKNYVTVNVEFQNITYTVGNSDESFNCRLISVVDGSVLSYGTFQDGKAALNIFDEQFTSNQIEFYIDVEFNQPVVWLNCYVNVDFKYYNPTIIVFGQKVYATFYQELATNNNTTTFEGTKIDIIKALPNTKVIDFVTSYFKMLNISIYDSSPDNNLLYWLNPNDVATENNVYSKATLDYTPYVDLSTVKKSLSNEYNYFNFKHTDSKYRSNVDYKTASGMDYGQLTYPETKPTDANEYKIETNFSIIPPVTISGADNIVTYYGFTADNPEKLETGESRYTPNYNELTLFYYHGITGLGTDTLSFQKTSYLNSKINSQLTNYNKVLPWATNSFQSLAFSILVFKNISYVQSLYLTYYRIQTERLLDVNALKQEFDLMLPVSELYLNEQSTIQGQGNIPSGFRLQNDIIIGETLFSIIDATIDRVSGKAKLTLLNYT